MLVLTKVSLELIFGTMNKTKRFIYYAATHPGALVTYYKSDIVLVVHSDISHPSKPKARSHMGDHFPSKTT